jgi:gliding motility-associated-like protein
VLTFQAIGTTATFHVSDNGCSITKEDEAVLSLLNLSCSAPEDKNQNMMDLQKMAVLQVNGGSTVTELIEEVFIGGGCFEISNVQLIGNAAGVGQFSQGAASVILDEGVILESGNIGNAPGPNNSNSAGNNLGGGGDADLAQLSGGAIFDAVGIEFDFTPTVPLINFDYVFGSEEYCEWVGSTFNDVFGFFISGPGISGPFTNGAENIALIPGTGTYVAINTVNHTQNTGYFNPNQGNCGGTTNMADIQFDGYTTVLTATAEVIPCETYHIKLVVSDVGDGIYDSAVFLGANSFEAGNDASASIDIPGVQSGGTAFEGCAEDGCILFERNPDSPIDVAIVIDFEIDPASTATNGVDYTQLNSPVTIPAGQSSVCLPIEIFTDNITEGLESVILVLSSACTCEGLTVEFFIGDVNPIVADLSDLEFCDQASGTLDPSPSGGVPEYTYQWSNGATSPTIDLNNTSTTTYSVTITDDCNQTVEESVIITVIEVPNAEIAGTASLCGGIAGGDITITFTGAGPWEFIYTIDGAPYGPIVTSDNPFILPFDQPGTYELISLFAGDCEGYVNGSATVLESTIDIFDVPIDLTCNSSFDGLISVFATGGTEPYEYLWDNGETSETIDGLAAGTYTVTVTDADGCTEEYSSTIAEPEPIILVADPLSEADCNNPSGGEVDVTVSGGTPGYIFLWDNGETSEDLINVPAGTYTVTVFDNNSCSEETTVVVSENIEPPTGSANGATLDCIQTEVTITGSGSSSSGGSVTYEWFDGSGTPISNSASVLVNQAGTYTFVVTDGTNGCTVEVPVVVDTNFDFPTAVGNADGIITCTDVSVTLSGSGSSGNGTISYQWLNQNGAPVGTGVSINVTTPGTYTLVVTDGTSGCTDEAIVPVDINIIPPNALIFVSDALDCTTTIVTLDGSGSTSGGGGQLALQWLGPVGNPLGNGPTIDVNQPGIYTLIVTDTENGCIDEVQANVTQNITPPPIAATVSGVITCTETFVTISTNSGDNGNDIEWYNPAGSPMGSDPDIVVTVPGTYTLIVTGSGNGCTSQTTIAVTENVGLPTADAGADATITCASEFAILNGSGSSTNGSVLLEWYNAGGVPMGTGGTIEVNQAGTYTLIVTDPVNGCTAESLVTVTPDAEIPSLEILPPADLTCLNGLSTLSATTNATGNIQQGWYNEAGTLISTELQIDVNVGGVYTFIVTNLDNDCSAEASVLVADLIEFPIPIAEPLGELTCIETVVILDGSLSDPYGSLLYEWIDPNGSVIGDESVVNAILPGTYTLNITNFENGCTATTNVTVTSIVALPTAVAVPDGLIACNNNIVDLNGSGSSGNGSLTYAWYNGTIPLGTTVTQQVNAAGTYTLVVTDALNGCTAQTNVVVGQNLELPIPQINVPAQLNCITETVTLNGSGSSGNGPITFQWFGANGAPLGTGSTLSVNTAGTYTLIVTNGSNGCTAQTQATVAVNEELPIVSASADGPLTCADLSVNLTGSGSSSSGTLTYQWLNASCTSQMPVTVTENVLLPVANAGPAGLLTCDVLQVSLNGSGSSSGNNITYEWTNAGGVIVGNTPTILVDQTGTYTLVVTNTTNGCTALATTTVSPDAALPIANAGPGAVLDCEVLTAILNGSGSSSGAGMAYEWLDPNGVSLGNALSLEVDAPGTYTLVVSNTNNGCTAEASVQVSLDNIPPVADPGTSPMLDCATSQITLNGGGSTAATSYVWTNAGGTVISNNASANVNAPGTYQLLVTADNGCTDVANITVAQDIAIPIADPGIAGNLNCTTTQVLLGGSNTSQGPGITYEWIDAAGNVVATTATYAAAAAGNYTLYVYNNNNSCESFASVLVAQDAGLPTANAGPPALINCNIFEVTLDGSGSSSGNNFSYEWLDANGNILGLSTQLQVSESGTYTLLVTDASNGCVAQSQVTVAEDFALPVANAGQGQLLTCDIDEVTLNGSASSVLSGPITYEWINAGGVTVGNTAIVNVSQAGTYQLLITGQNGCTDFAEVNVLLDDDIPVADAGPGGDINCLINSITLGGSLTSAGTTISYEWVDANGSVVATTPTFQTTTPGIYTLTVNDTNNDCSSSSSAEVAVQLDIPVADPGTGGTLTCDLTQLFLGGIGTTAGPNISYLWTNASGASLGTNDDLLVNAPGTYTLTVNNGQNGCSATATVVVDENQLAPNADAGPDGLLTCLVDDAYTLDGSASAAGSGISYNWYNENNVLISQETTFPVTNTGDYTLVVSNSNNGCTSSDIVAVVPDENEPTAIAAPVDELNCAITTVTLDGSASVSNSGLMNYEWLDANGNTISTEAIGTVNEPGIYTLVITDGQNFCEHSINVDITQDLSAPSANAGAPAMITCDVTEVTLNGSGTNGTNLTYQWLNPNGVDIGNTTSVQVSTVGTYTLVVTNGANGCTDAATTLVSPDANLPEADAGPNATLTCAVTEVSLSGTGSTNSGNMTMEWFAPNGAPILGSNTINVNQAGIYTLIITDNANNCTAESLVEVLLDNQPPVVDEGPDQLLDCQNEVVTLFTNNTSAVSYEWTDANGNVLGNSTSIDVTTGGDYQVSIVGANGCSNNATINVAQDAGLPTADTGPGGTLDCNTTVINLGGSQTSSGPGITYQWLDVNNQIIATTPTISVTQAGVYTLTVLNSINNCDVSSSVTIALDDLIPTVDPGIGGTLTCDLVQINLGGGNTSTGNNIEYAWTNASGQVVGNDLELMVNTPGMYTLTVNNTANDCSDFASVNVGQDVAYPFSDAGPESTLTCETTSVTLDGSNSSTGTNIVYTWTDEQGQVIGNTPMVNVTTSGTFTLSVMNTDNGCSTNAEVIIIPDENIPSAIASNPDELTCTIVEVLLSGTGSTSVSGALTYEWQDAANNILANTEDIMVNAPGWYTLVITDPNNGCTDEISVEVPQDIIAPTANAGTADLITCTVPAVELSGSGIGNNLSYEWFNASNISLGNTPTISVAAIGTYTLVVTDGSNGCVSSATVSVMADDDLPDAIANVNEWLTCITDVVQVSALGSSSGSDISYQWLNPQGLSLGSATTIDVSNPGLYTLIVTDQNNNCVAQTTVLVQENETPPQPDINAIGASSIDCDNLQVVLDATSSTPAGSLNFQWSTLNGNIVGSTTGPQIDANEAGVYTLLVTNTINGCTETSSFEVEIDQAVPNVNIAAPPVLTCLLTSFNLNTNGTSTNGNFSYTWTNNISAGQGTLTPTITNPGTYTLTVVNEDNGCESSESISVTENVATPDAAAATGDELDCVTPSVELSGSGSSQGAGFTYQWTGPGILSGANGLSPDVNAPGNYQLLVTNTNNGCTEVAVTEVSENEDMPSAAALVPEPPLCFGGIGGLAVVAITGGAPPYTYSIDEGLTYYPDSTFNVPSGTYTVWIQDAIGCEYQQDIYVPQPLPVEVQVGSPDVQVGSDVVRLQLGAGTQLQAFTNIPNWAIDSIIWTPTDSLSCTDCLNPYANPTSTTTYRVTIVNENGCDDFAEIRVEIDKDRKVYIPNAFSPNDDGDNDLFMIYASEIGIKQINYFQVYSRWGEMIYQAENFQPNDPANGWGGLFRGEMMNPGVFVYWAEVEFVDGFKGFYKGDVTLFR